MTAPIIATSQTWTSFLTLDDVKDWLQFPANAGDQYDGNLQRVIDMACSAVQKYINRPVAPTTITERHDGWGGEYIMLDYSPIIEVVSCNEYQSFGGLIVLPESTPENDNEGDGIQVNYLTGQIMRTFAGGLWPRGFFPGSRNIEITYVAGYNPLDPALWMATVQLVKHWWVNTQQASRQVIKGDFDPAGSQGGMFPGMPYHVSSLLQPFRKIVIG